MTSDRDASRRLLGMKRAQFQRLNICVIAWLGGLLLATWTSEWPINQIGNMIMGGAIAAWVWRDA